MAEIKNFKVKTEDVTNPAIAADDKYFYNNNPRMYDPTLDFVTATAACRDMHRQLVTPKTDSENQAISYIKTASWVGYSDEAEEGVWLDTYGKPLGITNYCLLFNGHYYLIILIL